MRRGLGVSELCPQRPHQAGSISRRGDSAAVPMTDVPVEARCRDISEVVFLAGRRGASRTFMKTDANFGSSYCFLAGSFTDSGDVPSSEDLCCVTVFGFPTRVATLVKQQCGRTWSVAGCPGPDCGDEAWRLFGTTGQRFESLCSSSSVPKAVLTSFFQLLLCANLPSLELWRRRS